ncbi:MAG: hypothetical protein KAJ18_01835, partial [Candidatus Omnitrophica bacterium]|nr:hypothetical protein [Candidatus Omnitrophota bacterium]
MTQAMDENIGEFRAQKSQNMKSTQCIVAESVLSLFEAEESPVLIAVGGPGGTGKSSFSRQLAGCLPEASVLRLDDYKTSRSLRKEDGIFGAHPQANDMEMIEEHLAMLKSGLTIDKPVYNPETGCADRTESYHSAKFHIIDGEVSTYEAFRHIVDFFIFIDADLTTQLNTRLVRDVQSRNYSQEKALATFWGSNVREFFKYGIPTKKWADIVLFCQPDYSLEVVAVSPVVQEKMDILSCSIGISK